MKNLALNLTCESKSSSEFVPHQVENSNDKNFLALFWKINFFKIKIKNNTEQNMEKKLFKNMLKKFKKWYN